jgi:heat-inducible transcriptional repressor
VLVKIDGRKQRVLESIIKDYVATAEPVGSRTIARKYNLGVSPATIRNEMADLEEMGFIEQPHTSAGRIPSQLGYRYYVDCLMETYNLTDEEQSQIQSKFLQKMGDLEQVVLETSKLLSQFTNYTAMVMSPMPIHGKFRQVELIQLQAQTALMVVVTESGAVIHKILEFQEPVSALDLYRVSQTFNSKMKGITFSDIQRTLLRELYDELQEHKDILNLALELLDEYLHAPEWDKVYLGGIINILNQPEFRDVQKIRRILGVLEEESEIRDLLTESKGIGVMVRIGGENRREEFQDCSVITVTYEIEGKAVGRIGLLGPTRMEYPKATSVLEYISLILSEVFRSYHGR